MYSQSLHHHWLCHGKLIEMTVPRGTVGCCLYAAAANQEARIESHDSTSSLQTTMADNGTNPSILSNISLWYQDVEVSKDF